MTGFFSPRTPIRATNPTITAAEFRAQFPEFSVDDYPDSMVDDWIEQARSIYNWRKLAIMYLAAHLIAVFNQERTTTTPASLDSGSTGQVQSQTVGPLSVTYRQGAGAVMNMAANESMWFYDRSTYGRMYLELRRATPGVTMSVRSFG